MGLIFSEVGYKEFIFDFCNQFIFHGRDHYADVSNETESLIGRDKGRNLKPTVGARQSNHDSYACEGKGEN